MSNTIYSQEQLQTMNTIQLLSIAKSLLIPAGANWTDKQIIPVIDYYQKHSKKKQNTFFKMVMQKFNTSNDIHTYCNGRNYLFQNVQKLSNWFMSRHRNKNTK
eukprot:537376_1